MPFIQLGIPTICFVLVFCRIIVILIEIVLSQIIVHFPSNSECENVYSFGFLTLVLLCPLRLADLLWHCRVVLEQALIFGSIARRPVHISSAPGLHIPGEPVRTISPWLLAEDSYPGERSDERCHRPFFNRKICSDRQENFDAFGVRELHNAA